MVIAGYPDEPCTVAGERMVLRVSTDAPAFRVLAFRWGARLEPAALDHVRRTCTAG